MLEILLRHGGTTLESSIHKGWWTLHDLVWVHVHGASRLAELLLNLALVSSIKRLNLGCLPVEELPGHSWLAHGDGHATLKLLADIAWLDVVGLGDDDVLLPVVVGIGGSKILGILDGSLAVAVIQVGDDLRVQVLDLFLEWG